VKLTANVDVDQIRALEEEVEVLNAKLEDLGHEFSTYRDEHP
jgi:hypothetical protein